MDELENRIIELEIRLALQDELDLQQAQLRLLYNNIQQQSEGAGDKPYSLADEVPPHY